ncbi:MAG: type II toxin-antitoxin system VapC family toxin [Kineosporiaceae bacterium]
MTGPVLLLDTSAAVALVLPDHEFHDAVRRAVQGHVLGLAGHAAFETYSILTRLPPPARLTPESAAALVVRNFPASEYLGAADQADAIAEMAAAGISGGSVYDALVGSCAAQAGHPLLSCDRRARDTYRATGVSELRLETAHP